MNELIFGFQYCKTIDFCWGGNEVLLNSKRHIDRREAEVIMNCLLFNNTSCSLKQTSRIVLFYKRLKGLSFRSQNAKFWFESYLVANSQRQVFSWRGSFIFPVWYLNNHYPTKSGQKTHPYTFSLLKNFRYHQNNKSVTCTCKGC